MKILLIEDEKNYFEILIELLKEKNFDIIHIKDSKQIKNRNLMKNDKMNPMKKNAFNLKSLIVPLVIFSSFWAIAIVLWQTTGNIFYVFNFGYIGTV